MLGPKAGEDMRIIIITFGEDMRIIIIIIIITTELSINRNIRITEVSDYGVYSKKIRN